MSGVGVTDHFAITYILESDTILDQIYDNSVVWNARFNYCFGFGNPYCIRSLGFKACQVRDDSARCLNYNKCIQMKVGFGVEEEHVYLGLGCHTI